MALFNDPLITHHLPCCSSPINRIVLFRKSCTDKWIPHIIMARNATGICPLVNTVRFCTSDSFVLKLARNSNLGTLSAATTLVASYRTWETRTHTGAKSKSRRSRNRSLSHRRRHASLKRRPRASLGGRSPRPPRFGARKIASASRQKALEFARRVRKCTRVP